MDDIYLLSVISSGVMYSSVDAKTHVCSGKAMVSAGMLRSGCRYIYGCHVFGWHCIRDVICQDDVTILGATSGWQWLICMADSKHTGVICVLLTPYWQLFYVQLLCIISLFPVFFVFSLLPACFTVPLNITATKSLSFTLLQWMMILQFSSGQPSQCII